MAIQMKAGNLPHIYWIDLNNDGMYVECAVMKQDNLGNVYFFPLTAIDQIDKRRLAKIVSNRNAQHFELWDLMSNITLNNGVNALDYFHQLVRMKTPSGKEIIPQRGVVGFSSGVIDTKGDQARYEMENQVSMAAKAAATAAAEAATSAIKSSASQQQAAPTTVKKTNTRKTPAKKTSDAG